MSASAEERIRQLTKGMLRKKLYVVLSKGGATPEQIGAVLPDHLEYMIGLEKSGALFASGPLTATDGKMAGDLPGCVFLPEDGKHTCAGASQPGFRKGRERLISGCQSIS